jgi:valyl-tRNA synthetase
MMMFGLFAMKGVPPFHIIALHGLVRDKHGKKMSKSKGNTIDPIEFMDRYGSDALRFTLARGSNPGADQALAEEWVAGSRNFATKLWNASRFALLNGAHCNGALPQDEQMSAVDIWIMNQLSEMLALVDTSLENFEFAKASEAIYHFAWDDLCDWYLELSKSSFASSGASAEVSRRVLGEVLDNLLRVLHPFMPFITEALWCKLTGGESIVIAKWPKLSLTTSTTNSIASSKNEVAQRSQEIVEDLQALITEIRRFRNDQGIKNSTKIAAKISGLGDRGLEKYEEALRFLVKLDMPGEQFASSGRIEVKSFTVEFDLTGSVDLLAERLRLEKDLIAIEKDLATAKVKLENKNFMAKAPEEVVSEIRERERYCAGEIERITSLLAALSTN